ncbi:MAG: hypothetical protein BWK80_33360 [Desulfobacteraceae bacterium IS3]|nr:MAG: hypothetical protein BWK80_33360 [Desulfobacteraceae bacterium IS3]
MIIGVYTRQFTPGNPRPAMNCRAIMGCPYGTNYPHGIFIIIFLLFYIIRKKFYQSIEYDYRFSDRMILNRY